MPIPPQLLLQFLPMLLSMGGGQARGAGGNPAFMQGMQQGLLPMLMRGTLNSPAPLPLRGGLLGSLSGLASGK